MKILNKLFNVLILCSFRKPTNDGFYDFFWKYFKYLHMVELSEVRFLSEDQNLLLLMCELEQVPCRLAVNMETSINVEKGLAAGGSKSAILGAGLGVTVDKTTAVRMGNGANAN